MPWAIAGAALIAADCAPSDASRAGGAGSRVLVAAIGTDPGHLNPAVTTSGTTHTASELLYNGLLALTPELEPVPELAAEWEVSQGGRVYRFRLRDDVRWHDGQPFTSADVVYTFREVLLRYHSRTRASLGDALQAIEAPDPHTVVFRFAKPYAPLLQQLDVGEAPILPRHLYAGSDPLQNPRNLAPVGTGPFRFESYVPDVEIRYSANRDYFKAGLPRLDGVVLRIIPDSGTQVLAFEAGEVQWLFGVPGPDRERLAARPDVQLLETTLNPGGSNCILTMAYNLDRPALRDARTRRAIAHGIDRAKIVERVYFGQARVARAPISEGIAFAHGRGIALPAYDPGEAERLLEESGWHREGRGVRAARGVAGVPDGTPLQLRFLHFPSFAPSVEVIRAELRGLGVEIVQVPLEPPVFVKRVFEARDFDLDVVSYCNGTDPEIGVRRMYVSDAIAPVPFSNNAGYTNPEVDELFDLARGEIDRDERRRHYQRIQEIVAGDLPYFWLIEAVGVRAYRAPCEGFTSGGHFAEGAACGG